MSYKPIRDYGLIGDTKTAALVGLDGSIDWLCWPRFDSPSVFGALLDKEKGGCFAVHPTGTYQSGQEYIANTNVLVTIFETATGHCEVVDFLAVGGDKQELCRLVTCQSGEMELEIIFEPRPNYGRGVPRLEKKDSSIIASATGNSLELYSGIPLQLNNSSARQKYTIRRGDKKALILGSRGKIDRSITAVDALFENSIKYWRQWLHSWTYEGPWSEYVARSALVVKALTYEPTGLIIAAPTTSLPEQIGGTKNWDYRYVWLRDAAMILEAMFHLGHMKDVGKRFMDFVVKQGGKDPEELRIMYDIDGQLLTGEEILPELEGYQKSKPVRVGNEAANQFQLDVYGEVLYCARRYLELTGQLTPEVWGSTITLADYIIDKWDKPDMGIWEERGEPRHYTHSKVMCAVGLKSVLIAQKQTGYPAPTKRWKKALNIIKQTILERAWNPQLNSFTKIFGGAEVDASCLLMSVYDFLPATDERMRSTADRIIHNLGYKGLIYRFKYPGEELGESEGAFTIASLWLAIHFIKLGQLDFAAQYIQAIIDSANHLGLFSEEIEAVSGRFLGNFPQLFVHTALIDAIHFYNRAKKK